MSWKRILLSSNHNSHREQKAFTQILSHKVGSARCLDIGVQQTWVQFLVPSDQLCDVGEVTQPL